MTAQKASLAGLAHWTINPRNGDTTMTRAQYDAIMHIAEYGPHTEAGFLNVRPQTMIALIRRGWVHALAGTVTITEAGWAAVEAL